MKRNKQNQFLDHPKPVTRRDFLSRGTLAFSATLFAPTLIGQILKANVKEPLKCSAAVGSNFIPMLVFDCAGGAALPGNFLVGGSGGPQDLLKSYDTLGWNPRDAGAVDTRFGLPMASKVSKILSGMLASMSTEAQANFRMGSFLHASQDDSQINLTSALILALEQGVNGSIIQRGLGTGTNFSGGNTGGADQSASMQPIVVSSVQDVIGAVSMGPVLDLLSVQERRNLLQAAQSMSQNQLSALAGGDIGAFGDQMSCAYQNAASYADVGASLDPRNDKDISKIYQLTSSTAVDSSDLISATIVMNVLKKQSGPGVITIAGCDYHDGSQTTGDQIDLTIGTQIGRAIESARLLGQPLFIQIITDGGLFAETGTRNWSGDSGDKSMTVIGYYNPKAAPKLMKPLSPQVGAYNQGQAADQSSLIGADTAKVAYATLANYMQINGTLSQNADVFSGQLGQNLDQVLLFETP